MMKMFVIIFLFFVGPYNPMTDNLVLNTINELNRQRYCADKEPLELDYNMCIEARKRASYCASQKNSQHVGSGYRESVLATFNYKTIISEFIFDKGNPDFGHRKHLLGENNNDRKVGISVIKNGEIYYCVIITDL